MNSTGMARAVGVISGTSMDGIDVSMLDTDGLAQVTPGPGATYPYAPALRKALLGLLAHPEIAETDPLRALEEDVTDAHCEAVRRFLRENSIDPAGVALAGLHGQTVYHRPEKKFTRQLLDGARAAAALGLPVVNRFRHADVAAGGEGAPFAPLFHKAMVSALAHPVMVLNLGGVANVTYVDAETVIAFDTGPASALLDDFVARRTGKPFDEGGALAASGKIDVALVAEFMANPFFARPAPKSLDRQDFHARARGVEALSDADGAATLAAFTIESVAAALAHVPRAPKLWLVCGGGRLNATFMRRLGERLQVKVAPVESIGWNGDVIEAQCFAYLGLRSARGLPLSLPATTGVPHPLTGGELWPAPHG